MVRLLDIMGGNVAPHPVGDDVPPEFHDIEPRMAEKNPGRIIVINGNQPEQERFVKDGMPGHTLATGGWGCVAGDTKIDLADGRQWRIDLLWAIGAPVNVITAHGSVWCPPPVKGPKTQLYRVTLQGGATVEVTGHHRFFSAGAWIYCRELRPGASVLCPQPSISGIYPQVSPASVRHSSRNTEDFADDYPTYCRSCGRQLLSSTDICASSLPSSSGVREPYPCERVDDSDARPAHTQTCPACDHDANSGSLAQSDRAVLPSILLHPGNGARFPLSLPPQRQSPRLKRHQRTLTGSEHHSGDTGKQAWDYPLGGVIQGVYRVITGIQPTRVAEYYDINVPGFGHYSAHEMWHHNSGKSWAGSTKFLIMHRFNMCEGMLVAPTYDNLARVMIPYLLERCEDWGEAFEYWPQGKRGNQFPHLKIFGELIYLFSGEKPEAIRSVNVWGGWGDESAVFKSSNDPKRDTHTQIKGRMRNNKAKSLHWIDTTTPEGTNTQIQRNYVDKPLPRHRSYRLLTRLNDANPADYADTVAATIPEEMVGQYLEGIAHNYSAKRAHKGFSRARNVRTMPWRPGEPAHIGCDFNVSPMCWTVGQWQANGDFCFLDELVIEDHGRVDQAVHQVHARGWAADLSTGSITPRHVTIHPDKSSKNRSTTSDPEVTVLLDTAKALGWKIDGDASGANPPVASRINNLDRCFWDANQKTRVFVHPRCTRLIAELEQTGRLADGKYDPGPDKLFGHILDGAGYLIWDLYPIHRALEFSRY